MITRYKFFTILFLFHSCAFIQEKLNIPKDEKVHDTIGAAPQRKDKTPLFCSETKPLSFLGSNENNLKKIDDLFKNNKDFKRLNFVEKAVSYSLLQIFLKPNETTPQSKLDILYLNNGKVFYKSFSASNGAPSFIYGLDSFLKEHGSKHTVITLSKLIDQTPNLNFTIDKNFERFLNKNAEWLKQNSLMRKMYFRAEDFLKEGESLPKFSLVKNLNYFSNEKTSSSYITKNSLYPYKDKFNISYQCNYEMELYKKDTLLVSPYIVTANVFALKEDKNLFIASTSLKLEKEKQNDSPFIAGSSLKRSSAFCFNKTQGLFSKDSRDPGQLLFNILDYGIGSSSSHQEFNKFISFSRHIFLTNPPRLAFESLRATEDQLNKFLKLGLPVYHSNNLGNIFGWNGYKENYFSFHIDERSPGNILCQK